MLWSVILGEVTPPAGYLSILIFEARTQDPSSHAADHSAQASSDIADPDKMGSKYWNYTVNEMGLEDITAQIDHIHVIKCGELNVRGQAGIVAGPLAKGFMPTSTAAGSAALNAAVGYRTAPFAATCYAFAQGHEATHAGVHADWDLQFRLSNNASKRCASQRKQTDIMSLHLQDAAVSERHSAQWRQRPGP